MQQGHTYASLCRGCLRQGPGQSPCLPGPARRICWQAVALRQGRAPMRMHVRGRQAPLLPAARALLSLHTILLESATIQPCGCLTQLKLLLHLPRLAVSAVV